MNEIIDALSMLSYHMDNENQTMEAISKKYARRNDHKVIEIVPFSSQAKWSGISFEDVSYILGAPEIVLKDTSKIDKELNLYTSSNRTILLGKVNYKLNKTLPLDVEPMGLVIINDKVRLEAKATLEYFKEQAVDIKLIYGDNTKTVAGVAEKVGLTNIKYIDMSRCDTPIIDMVDDYNVFGRVKPKQKKEIVMALKAHGHTVAMTGDGVNDVLAFKEADVSIAMASGSDVAKSSANLVLLDSNFDALPEVLYEGRRVINNIQRVATLFLTKTIFSILLAFITIILPFEYPFVPIHLNFVSSLTIGIPAFFMAIEPNRNRVEKKFLENVIKVSLPSAVSVILCIIYIYIIASIQGFSSEVITQLAVITIAINGCIVLTKVSHPFTLLRKIILVFVYIGIAVGLFWAHDIISMLPIRSMSILLDVGVIALILIAGSKFGSMLVEKIYERKK